MIDISKSVASKLIAISIEFGIGINEVAAIYNQLSDSIEDDTRNKLNRSIAVLLQANFQLVELVTERYPDLDPDKGKDIVLDPELQKILDQRKSSK